MSEGEREEEDMVTDLFKLICLRRSNKALQQSRLQSRRGIEVCCC